MISVGKKTPLLNYRLDNCESILNILTKNQNLVRLIGKFQLTGCSVN